MIQPIQPIASPFFIGVFNIKSSIKPIAPMLCHEVDVDGSMLKECGMDGPAATKAYRKGILEALAKLKIRGYVAERKFDGTRVLAISEDDITLQNRNGVLYTIRLPEIIKSLQAFHGHWMILDGEVVFINSDGEEEFTPCQRRCSTHFPDPLLRQQFPVKMEVFDILQADDKSMEKEPYLKRKECLLENFFADDDGLLQENSDTVQYVQFETDLQLAWKEAVRKNREGLIVKQIDSPYEHERSYSWLKVKNWIFESCDVVGFTAGEGARSPFFGSLVLAQNGKFRGCVGSGFNEWELRKTKDTLTDSSPTEQPFSHDQVGESYKAVNTKLQVLVKHYQTTDAGIMRFPVFITSN